MHYEASQICKTYDAYGKNNTWFASDIAIYEYLLMINFFLKSYKLFQFIPGIT